ncbi:MAG TPA: histidinol dehydrogenase [Vicinamibacterales bacterium]|jgi:histidinol dehydrogenase
MRIIRSTDGTALENWLRRWREPDERAARAARRIVDDVRRRGDAAVRAWSRRLDGIDAVTELSARELRRGWSATPRDVRAAIRVSARHLRRVAERQLPRPFSIDVCPGVRIEQRVQPLERVGCYVPGGRYPLPSTLLMTAVPARVAGVGEVLVACPRPTPAVCTAALEAGVTRVIRVGGAQAIAALAYGTASIARVDKVVGPGNAWVAAAKTAVSPRCGVEFHAGPSEIVVFSAAGRAEWIALDLIAQAEHDPDARAVFVTTRAALAAAVLAAVRRLTPRQGPAGRALRRHGAVIVTRSHSAAIDVVNRLAPEHLVCDRAADAAGVRAGTVFVGRWSAQAAGDYCTGSNHVLPTGGAAGFRGGLSAADFVRTFSVQTLSRRGLRTIGRHAMALAGAEGLQAHRDSIRVRMRDL